MRLAGKRAFVSGAGGGIGEAAALKFAREGAHVLLLRSKPSWMLGPGPRPAQA